MHVKIIKSPEISGFFINTLFLGEEITVKMMF